MTHHQETLPPAARKAGEALAASTGSAEIAAALETIRQQRQPTRRGIILCFAAMGEMLRLGWRKEQLDALEILWWSVRDGNGEVFLPNHKL